MMKERTSEKARTSVMAAEIKSPDFKHLVKFTPNISHPSLKRSFTKKQKQDDEDEADSNKREKLERKKSRLVRLEEEKMAWIETIKQLEREEQTAKEIFFKSRDKHKKEVRKLQNSLDQLNKDLASGILSLRKLEAQRKSGEVLHNEQDLILVDIEKYMSDINLSLHLDSNTDKPSTSNQKEQLSNVKRKPGRPKQTRHIHLPRKKRKTQSMASSAVIFKKKIGRPRKIRSENVQSAVKGNVLTLSSNGVMKKKLGRPKKTAK